MGLLRQGCQAQQGPPPSRQGACAYVPLLSLRSLDYRTNTLSRGRYATDKPPNIRWAPYTAARSCCRPPSVPGRRSLDAPSDPPLQWQIEGRETQVMFSHCCDAEMPLAFRKMRACPLHLIVHHTAVSRIIANSPHESVRDCFSAFASKLHRLSPALTHSKYVQNP